MYLLTDWEDQRESIWLEVMAYEPREWTYESILAIVTNLRQQGKNSLFSAFSLKNLRAERN